MKPITSKQTAYLSRLIAAVGKEPYLQAKHALGLADVTIMQLTSYDASRLIDALLTRRGTG